MRCVQRGVAPRAAGVSLIEILVSLTILALLVGLAVPAFSHQRRDWAITTATNEWMALLQRAKLESITRGRPVVMCTANAVPECTSSQAWTAGHLTFIDENRSGSLDGADTILHRELQPPRLLRIRGNGPVSRYVNFHSDGVPRLFSGAFQAGTFTLCLAGETDPRYFRQLVLSAPGRLRVDRPTGVQPVCQ